MKTLMVVLAVILLFTPYLLVSGELSILTKKEPLIVHGSTAASFNFHKSNDLYSAQPSAEWNLNGNYSIQIFGIDLPFSFIMNRFSQSYTHPFTQFGISPTYKWVKLNLGSSNIRLSQICSAGYTFKGTGIELTPNKLRLSAFYGSLIKTENNDTSWAGYGKPKYSGIGYGAKLGFGTIDNYLDLSYFHGVDDGSVSSFNNAPVPDENEVIGIDFKVKLHKVASLTGSVAANTIYSTYNSGNIPPWALEAAFSLDLKNLRSTLSYRNVRSDFRSMGISIKMNDGQTISLTNGLTLAKWKLNVNTIIMQQSNDESIESSGEMNAILSSGNKTISGNLNFRRFCEKHPVTGQANQTDNLSASVIYNSLMAEKSTNFSLTASYNSFVSPGSSSSTFMAALSAGTNLMKNRSLNLNGSAGYSYNDIRPGDLKGNFTFSCNASFQPRQNSVDFFVSYSVMPHDERFSMIDYTPYHVTTQNLTAGISYTVRF
jgi:hypothetical protein